MDKRRCKNFNNCNNELTGRSDQQYCSGSCKSVVNNARQASRNTLEKAHQSRVRNNRRILSMLYELFGDFELERKLINQTKIEQKFNTGLLSTGNDTTLTFFNDYALENKANAKYRVIKQPPKKKENT